VAELEQRYFEITVHDSALMAVVKGLGQGLDNVADSGLVADAFFDEAVKKVFAFHVLHDNIEVSGVVVHLVDFDNIIVFQLRGLLRTLNRISHSFWRNFSTSGVLSQPTHSLLDTFDRHYQVRILRVTCLYYFCEVAPSLKLQSTPQAARRKCIYLQ
jgi:hypothetical protein